MKPDLSDDSVLDAIMNPELPFEQIDSSEKLQKVAKSQTLLQERKYDQKDLIEYKRLQQESIQGQLIIRINSDTR